MNHQIKKLLSFHVSGRFAHFKKFYTNASSLSYFIPPRTVIIGMVSSILGFGRDTYYEIFHPNKFKISVSVTYGSEIKKQIQSMNYLHFKYHSILCGGKGGGKNVHTQCKLELLTPVNKNIDYTIYIAAIDKESLDIIDILYNKIFAQDFGFGIYLGQRQFRGYAGTIKLYTPDEILFFENETFTDTVCLQKNGDPDMNNENNSDIQIVVDQMPIHMESKKSSKKNKDKQTAGRAIHRVDRVMYEKSGNRIFGQFKNCYRIDEKNVTFYEG